MRTYSGVQSERRPKILSIWGNVLIFSRDTDAQCVNAECADAITITWKSIAGRDVRGVAAASTSVAGAVAQSAMAAASVLERCERE